jgi:hypothetical protein
MVMVTGSAPGWARTALALGLLILAGCFEDPVEEHVHVCFRPDGCYEITSVVDISSDPGAERNEALSRRLEETRRAHEEQRDAWARRFEALAASWERLVWERGSGRLTRVEHTAATCDPEGMSRFFADTGLATQLRTAGGDAVLEIVPGRPSRASRSQRDRVAAALGEWSEAVAAYLVAVDRLYSYLVGRPEAVRPCMAALYREALADRAVDGAGTPGDEGGGLVQAVRDARDRVLHVFDVPDGEAYDLNELSMIVLDPFPARLTLTLPGEPLETEGFERSENGTLRAGGLGFVSALEGLEGTWAAPDPLFTCLRALRSDPDGQLDLDALAALERRSSAPTAREVREALHARLVPARVYRVRWEPKGGGDENGAEARPCSLPGAAYR